MNGDDLFAQLEQKTFFVDYVKDHFEHAPSKAAELFPCVNKVSTPRIELAFGKFTSSLQTYKLLLNSENPDHYKRSGALLHSLYKSFIVTEVKFDKGVFGTIDEVESGEVLALSYSDCEHYLKYPKFYQTFYNEVLSYDLAYQCCAAYEDKATDYSFSFLENVCHYLHTNDDLNKDSLSMMFRSLMLQNSPVTSKDRSKLEPHVLASSPA